MTVRQAIQQLRNDGLVRAEQPASGVFVNDTAGAARRTPKPR